MRSNKGGVRPGAGRPKGDDKINKSFTLTPIVAEALADYANSKRLSQSWVVDEALRKFFGLSDEGKL